MELESHLGTATPKARQIMGVREEAARARFASFLNVRQEELAMTRNTSQAMLRVLRSIRWKEGDEFVISSSEHVSTIGFSWMLQSEYGVKTISVPSNQGDGVLLEALDSTLNQRSKLVCLSHVTSPDGYRLPVKEASEIANRHGVPVVVDGAQAVGVFPVDISSLGCDFYVGSGHKWVLGPMGTGYVWVSEDGLQDFRPDPSPDQHPWTKPGTPALPVTAKERVEIGTYNHALVIGLGKATEIVSDISIESIHAHIVNLSKLLREGAANLPRVRVLTPMEPERSGGLTSLMVDGVHEEDMRSVVNALYEKDQVLVKSQWLTAPPRPDGMAMRISVSALNTEDDVRVLLDGLKREISSI